MILAASYPYTGNGLGGLPDALEAIVTHEINGQYELYFRYPLTGLHYEELQNGKIVMAKPDDITDAQPFRIYRITKPLNGVVTVYARHLCYDLQGIVVEPFTAGSLTEAMLTIPTKCSPSSPITLQTTRTVASGITLNEPRPLWRLLGGQEGSLLDVYGGEWDFDKTDATLVTQLGQDRGVSVRYGKNLTELEQDATIEASYSGVFPYWYDEETNTLVTLTEKVVAVTGSVVTDRNLVLDCSDDFETEPTEQQLRDRANAYIAANSVGNMKASWKVSFVDTEDFIDQVALGDTLHVYYAALDVNATARAVKTEYDVLKEKYKSITVGRVKQNLAAIIVNDKKETDEKIKTTKSYLEQAIDEATYSITHGGGVFRAIYDGYNLKEIVSLDDPDITQALSVWRWNNGGFGHSSTGYNGQYTLALLPDGSINAEMITTGILNANIIRAGIIQDAAGKNSWNLDTGALTITDGMINVNTASDTADMIRFNYTGQNGDIFRTSMSSAFHSVEHIPQGATAADETSDLGAYGLFLGRYYSNGASVPAAQFYRAGFAIRQDFAQNNWSELYNNTFRLYDSAHTLRTVMDGNGKLWQYDTNGKERTYLEYGDIFLKDASEVTRTHLNSQGHILLSDSTGANRVAAYGTTGGLWLMKATDANTSLFITDTSDVTRTRLGYDALRFFDSSGNLTAHYPSNGLNMLVGHKSIDSNPYVGRVINLGLVTATEMGISGSASASVVAGAWLAFCVEKYPNAKQCVFEGVALANSYRMMRVMIYDTSDKSGIQPNVASGTMQFYNGDIVVFGANNYNVWTRNVTMSAQA